MMNRKKKGTVSCQHFFTFDDFPTKKSSQPSIQEDHEKELRLFYINFEVI